MNFKQALIDFKTEFDQKLDEFLNLKIEETKLYNPVMTQNLEYIGNGLRVGGKRFRPTMAYFGYKLIQPEVNPEIWNIGLALELFHSFALIHDDIIDKSLVRRGHPTIEAIYQAQFLKTHPQIDNKHYAASAAILGGDFALVLANQLIANLENSPKKIKMERLFYEMQFELVAGQVDDCFGVGLSTLDDLDEARIINMLKTKSGNYSIQKPLLMGAQFAGANQKQLDALKSSGEKLGLVFQIKDDILGIFGNIDEIGKSNFSDILEGKRTLLMARAYKQVNADQKAKFKTILGNEQASLEDILWLKDCVASSGVVLDLERYCLDLVLAAKMELCDVFDQENPALQFLLDLSDYLYQRTK